MAYDTLDPIGEWRADYRMATLAALIANVNRDRDKHPEPFSPAEFMPKFGEEVGEAQTVDELSIEEQVSFLEMLNAAFGGKDLRKKD